MKKLTLHSIIALICLLVISCKKNDPNPPIVTDAAFAQNFGNTVNRDFTIQIVDVANTPVPGASVKIGNVIKQSNNEGVAVIAGAGVYEKFAYVTAQKSGFINGSRTIVPTAGTNSIKIMLLPNTVTATVNTGITSNVSLPNGTKITFDGNFKTDAGAPYSGAVSVIVNHLDPSDPDLFDKMPGALFAKNAAGEARVLETYGMINVELKGSGGQQLQIVNTAQIEIPITTSQTNTAPAIIPLWHFDETTGYWKENGTATKSGGKYVGSVKHFSWWNADIQLQGILLKFKIVDGSGNPIPNLKTTLSNSLPTNTDSNGEASGFVPKNTSFSLKVYTNDACSTLLNTQTIGPFNVDTTLPNIVISTPITPCQAVPESINYAVDNGSQISNTANLTGTVTGNSFSITNGGNMFDLITINGNSILPGVYTTSSGFQINGGGLSGTVTNGSSTFNNFAMTYTILNIGAVGQFIDITFSGTYTEQVMTGMGQGYNVNHTISGSVHVIRN